MRIPPWFGNVIAGALVAAGGIGWIVFDGGTVRQALAITAGVGVISAAGLGIMRLVGRVVPSQRIEDAAIAGDLLLVRGDGGVRAYRLGNGGKATAPAAMPATSGADAVKLKTAVTYGDAAARLWLAGEHRLALHGLQPQPSTAPEFIDGQLLITTAIAGRDEAPLILVLHRRSLAPDADALLTSLRIDGTVRWTATLEPHRFARHGWLLVTDDLLVLVTDANHRCEAIALEKSTGWLQWRSRL